MREHWCSSLANDCKPIPIRMFINRVTKLAALVARWWKLSWAHTGDLCLMRMRYEIRVWAGTRLVQGSPVYHIDRSGKSFLVRMQESHVCTSSITLFRHLLVRFRSVCGRVYPLSDDLSPALLYERALVQLSLSNDRKRIPIRMFINRITKTAALVAWSWKLLWAHTGDRCLMRMHYEIRVWAGIRLVQLSLVYIVDQSGKSFFARRRENHVCTSSITLFRHLLVRFWTVYGCVYPISDDLRPALLYESAVCLAELSVWDVKQYASLSTRSCPKLLWWYMRQGNQFSTDAGRGYHTVWIDQSYRYEISV